MTNQEKATKIAQELMNYFTSLKHNSKRVISCIKTALDEAEEESKPQTRQVLPWQQQEPGIDH